MKAVKEGDISKVKHMTDMDRTLVNAENGNGLSAAITARYFGKNEIAELLSTAVTLRYMRQRKTVMWRVRSFY